jgi:hydroxyacylglutathione hydrolase
MEIIVENSDIKIERLELSTFATNAYIVICQKTAKSALIDAPAGARTIVKHLKGTNLECILLTHNHVDHIGGLKAIRARMPAALAVHPADNAKWLPFRPEMDLSDGDIIYIGKLKIECIYTPGHTPGSMCFKIGEYLLAGDTIFPGGPGRTVGPSEFKQIEKSIAEKIMVLPENTKIFPGHGASTILVKEKEEFAIFSARTHSPDLCGDVIWLSA